MKIDLSEWEMVISNGAWFLGKLSNNSLSPFWLVDGNTVEPQQGVFARLYVIVPMPAGGVSSLRIPEGAIRLSASAFRDRKQIENLISIGLRGEGELRAKASGLILPQ